jgi:putative PIN family toxin of toxin-antitoxin system
MLALRSRFVARSPGSSASAVVDAEPPIARPGPTAAQSGMDQLHRKLPCASPQRWVLDTNVWLDLLLFDDPRCAALKAALAEARAIALTDDRCREEWRRVLGYATLGLGDAAILSLQQRFDQLATPVDASADFSRRTLPRCSDADDQKFLELAAVAGADLLVTRDDALLKLDARLRPMALFRICRPDWITAAMSRSAAAV